MPTTTPETPAKAAGIEISQTVGGVSVRLGLSISLPAFARELQAEESPLETVSIPAEQMLAILAAARSEAARLLGEADAQFRLCLVRASADYLHSELHGSDFESTTSPEASQ